MRGDSPLKLSRIAALAATVTSVESEVARLQAESSGKPFNYAENEPSWRQFTRTAWQNSIQDRKLPPQGCRTRLSHHAR